MLASVRFNRQAILDGIEVEDVRTEGTLAAKLCTSEASVAKEAPKHALRVRRSEAERACIWSWWVSAVPKGFVCHPGFSLTLSLSRKGEGTAAPAPCGSS